MQIRTLDTWDQFTEELIHLYRDHETRQTPEARISSLLFRGQGNSEWELKTTLDRVEPDQLSLIEYYRIIHRIQPKLETFLGTKWDKITVKEYIDWTQTLRPITEVQLLAVPYFAYLRHHGFPSPLLDWSRSPYVAAYFAFRQPVKDATHISIYVYLEWANSHKSGSTGQPEIRGVNPRISVHKRHLVQQSEYTICTVDKSKGVCYARHQEVFERDEDDQDLLLKFNIPVSERAKALLHLSRMNINAFSLLGSDESLLEEMAITEFVLRPK